MTRDQKMSCIEWVGLTSYTHKRKLKSFYSFEKGKRGNILTKTYIHENFGAFPVYSGQTENNGVLGTIDDYEYDLDSCIFTTTVGAKVMTSKILNGKFSLSQNCLIMKNSDPQILSDKFTDYWLKPMFNYFRSLIPSYMQPSLRISDLKNYEILIPSYFEQQAIANFLDNKTEKIEELVTVQESAIDRLKEYKQSIITEAVTKGLNSNVKFKDCGFEWKTTIPTHWSFKKLKYFTDMNSDSLSDKTDGDFRISYIDIGSVNRNGEISNIQELLFKNAPSRAKRILKHDDVIISTVRTYLKAIAFVSNKYHNHICSTGFAVIRANSVTVSPRYIYYSLCSNRFINFVEACSVGTSYPAINSSSLQNMKVILPDFREQCEIAEYLDGKTEKITTLIQIKKDKIDRLKDYKKSLIYEAVTGKIEVM